MVSLCTHACNMCLFIVSLYLCDSAAHLSVSVLVRACESVFLISFSLVVYICVWHGGPHLSTVSLYL